MSNMAQHMSAISPFHVMDILARAKQREEEGHDIIHMEVGEPDFSTPPNIVEAGIQALHRGYTRYTPATGLPALKQAISDYYQRRYRLEINPQRIVITPGASGALQLVLSVLLNRGDNVILTDPGYPCNRNFVRLLGGESVPVAVTANGGFQPSLADLDTTLSQQPKALLLASPANPTGSVLSVSQVQEYSRWSQQHAVSLIVDEIYQGLEFNAPSHTALAADHEELFVINSFSKYFGMTGWRLGWLVAPLAYVDALERLAQNLFLAAPTMAQYAALQAFSVETLALLDERCQQLKARRDYLIPALQSLGFGIPQSPQGAFYLYADCHRFTSDSLSFCQQLLTEVGVAITPGKDFGQHEAHTHCRFAYTAPMDRLQEAVARLSRVLG